MFITLENPNDCDDIAQLREWVSQLQEMVAILRQLKQAQNRMIDQDEIIINQQDQKIALYMLQTELLKERISKYETAFSVAHFNDVRRLN